MNWKKAISNCFNITDREFATHENQRSVAQKLLHEALSQNVGFTAYIAEFESWLKSESTNQDHIDKQLSRISNLENYFQND